MIRIRIERSWIGHHPVTSFGFSNRPLIMILIIKHFYGFESKHIFSQNSFFKTGSTSGQWQSELEWLIINHSLIWVWEKCVFSEKSHLINFIDATDLSLCRRIKNAWVVDKKISWTYTQVYIEHNEILLCIYSVAVNDPKVTLNDPRRIHYRDMIGWYTFDSHWFKNRERAPIFVQSERGISLSLHWHQLFSFLPILRVINLCPRRITLETFIFFAYAFFATVKVFYIILHF